MPRTCSFLRQLRSPLAKVAVVIASLAPAAPARSGGSAVFQPLGFLHPDNAGPVIAYGISADGSVVVGEANSTTGFQAFRWTAQTGIVGLGAFENPGGFQSSSARACSSDGTVIVGASLLPDSLDESGSPFRWTQATGLVFLGSLGGSSGGVARAVSSDGSVAAGYSSNVDFDVEGFRWTQAGGMVGLGDGQASGISGDGSVIVGLGSSSYMWTEAGGPVDLLPATFLVVGLSRSGQYAVGANLGRAARLDLTSGTLLMIPHLPLFNNDTDLAWATNADGSVVVGYHNLFQFDGFFGRAFMWDAEHGTRIIRNVLVNDYGLGADLAGWELNNATAVSDDGLTIAGYGFAPNGEQAAWLAQFPQPSEPCAAVSDCADVNADGVRDDHCLWWSCAAGACSSVEIPFADMGGEFGSCPPDGFADSHDRFHALNCFSNQDTLGQPGYGCEDAPPQAFNVDAGGPFGDCAPDGVCDGHDAFHALNAFDGSTTCLCPGGSQGGRTRPLPGPAAGMRPTR
jgi:probable HAF family extracellular repeat protein